MKSQSTELQKIKPIPSIFSKGSYPAVIFCIDLQLCWFPCLTSIALYQNLYLELSLQLDWSSSTHRWVVSEVPERRLKSENYWYRFSLYLSPYITVYIHKLPQLKMSDRCTTKLIETTSDFGCADVHQENVSETYRGTSGKDKSTRESSQDLNVSLKTH